MRRNGVQSSWYPPGKAFILSAKITSKSPRNVHGEYEIIKWKSANLSKPSTIRLTQLHKLSAEDFDKKIGILQPVDRQLVDEKLGFCYEAEDSCIT